MHLEVLTLTLSTDSIIAASTAVQALAVSVALVYGFGQWRSQERNERAKLTLHYTDSVYWDKVSQSTQNLNVSNDFLASAEVNYEELRRLQQGTKSGSPDATRRLVEVENSLVHIFNYYDSLNTYCRRRIIDEELLFEHFDSVIVGDYLLFFRALRASWASERIAIDTFTDLAQRARSYHMRRISRERKAIFITAQLPPNP
jgi:hypothetical protein